MARAAEIFLRACCGLIMAKKNSRAIQLPAGASVEFLSKTRDMMVFKRFPKIAAR